MQMQDEREKERTIQILHLHKNRPAGRKEIGPLVRNCRWTLLTAVTMGFNLQDETKLMAHGNMLLYAELIEKFLNRSAGVVNRRF